MSRDEFVKRIEELDRLLVEEVESEELTDYARYNAHIHIESLIDIIKNNEGYDGEY